MKRLLAGAMALSMLTGTVALVEAPQAAAQVVRKQVTQHRNGVRTVRKTQIRPNGSVRTTVRQKWGAGQRLPTAYRNTGYVTDYNRYHLRRPPTGYRWVRRDNQFLLIAATTGLIASVIAASQ